MPRGWRITRYDVPGTSNAPASRADGTCWAVEHNGRRVVWGLHSADAAQRWLRRLTAPAQLRLVSPVGRPHEGATSTRRPARSFRTPPYWAA